MADRLQSKGRKENAAQPLGGRKGVVSHKQTVKSGKESVRRAGPDEPDAKAVGETFKRR